MLRRWGRGWVAAYVVAFVVSVLVGRGIANHMADEFDRGAREAQREMDERDRLIRDVEKRFGR